MRHRCCRCRQLFHEDLMKTSHVYSWVGDVGPKQYDLWICLSCYWQGLREAGMSHAYPKVLMTFSDSAVKSMAIKRGDEKQ